MVQKTFDLESFGSVKHMSYSYLEVMVSNNKDRLLVRVGHNSYVRDLVLNVKKIKDYDGCDFSFRWNIFMWENSSSNNGARKRKILFDFKK